MESQNKLVVVARYKENLDWVEDIGCSVVIYNKDEIEFEKYPNYKVDNIGRESDTFVRSIIDHYHLLNQFDTITFLQGNPFDHCPNLVEKINEHVHSYNILSNNIKDFDLMSDLYINGTHMSIISNMYGMPLNWQVLINVNDKELNFSKIFEQVYSVCEIMNISYQGKKYSWGHGAQYTVNTKLILSKSLHWWQELYKLLRYNYEKMQNQSFGYAMEKLWPLIWEHKS